MAKILATSIRLAKHKANYMVKYMIKHMTNHMAKQLIKYIRLNNQFT